jgi:hypothetical protein
MSTVTRNQPSGRSIYLNALIGAIATFVLSWLPLSPVIGGAVAGYLEGPDTSRGLKAGAISGLIAAIPVVIIAGAIGAFVVGVPILGAIGSGSGAGFGIGLGLIVIFAIGLVVGLAYSVGLSAAGGYLGAVLADQ